MPFWRSRNEEQTIEDLRLIVGLGNPGSKYDGTRHNIGYLVCERIAAKYGLSFKGSKQRADLARGSITGIPVLIALPITYMNESGNAVVRLLSYFRIPREKMLVVCDDIDLPFGTIRLRPSGSAGGQGGLKSIVRDLGTEEFARLRLGIGRPASHAIPHVLGSFPPEQARLLPALTEIVCDAIVVTLQQDVEAAMNRFNRDWLPELETP